MDHRKVHGVTTSSHFRGGAREVRAPAPHEGIGQSLRLAYADPAAVLPPELASLIDRLR
jgi:hypothetical protein